MRYYLRNKKKALVIILIILISAFCITFVQTLVRSVHATATEATVKPLERFSIAGSRGKTSESTEDAIRALEGFGELFPVVQSTTNIRTAFGTTVSYVLFTDDKSTIEGIMNRCGLTMTSGTVGDLKANEVIMHENILRNKGQKVGDRLGEYTVAGSFSGDTQISFGLVSVIASKLFRNQTSYVVFPEEGRMPELNRALKELDNNEWMVSSSITAAETLDKEFDTINLILNIVIIMVSVCIAIALAALVYTMYSSRYDEFAILNAIGYSKRNIQRKILCEIGLIAFLSCMLGYALALLALQICNTAIYSKMGQSMNVFSLESAVCVLILPVLLLLCTVIPIRRKLAGTDLISVIERR